MGKLKLVSVTKTSIILVNEESISREDIVKLSDDWNDSQITFFKKIVKQGGTFSINGNKFNIKSGEKVMTSGGVRDGGAPKMFGPEKE
mgnify:FL=1